MVKILSRADGRDEETKGTHLNTDLPQPAPSAPADSLITVKQGARFGALIRRAFSAFLLIGVLLACVPLMPFFPHAGIDSAWTYAMNEAVAHRMVFGRDIIFTFGPYASAFTRHYHPATDHLMLIADTLVGLAIAAGGLALVSRGRMGYLLPLPAVLALIFPPDAIFLVLPLIFFLVSVRVTLPAAHKWKLPGNWSIAASLAVMMLALSLLPLVKATLGAMSVSLGGLGLLLLLLWRPRWALILGAVFVAGLVGFWLAAKQPIWALPGFFIAQMPIISGYGDAMSLTGLPVHLLWYGINASLILLAGLLFFARGGGLSGKTLWVGLALSLFLVFKAAFIRDHGFIAADFILLASFFVATSLPHKVAAIIIASSVAAWFPTREHYFGMQSGNLIASLEHSETFGHLLEGLRVRLSSGQDLRKQFEAARAKIQQDYPLPRVDGSADIYPFSQDILLASGLQWSPRPIIQSYSAYEPNLADINADHLLGTLAPRHVFFDVFPIDGRLATLEDGKSWPLLLTRYGMGGRAGHFLVLDRNPGVTTAPEMEDISTSTQRLGQQFSLPKIRDPVWAEVGVRPTLLGRIFAVLFKLPQLHILIRYEDGYTESFRYLAAMGRSGFIISPVIHDTADFAALVTTGREKYFSGAQPTSVGIMGDAGTRLFWERTFEVRLRRIELPVQPGAEKFVYDEWVSDPPMNREIAGPADCGISAVNRKLVTTQAVDAKGPLHVLGWAAVSAQKGIAADEVFVTLANDDGSLRTARARAVPRPDVNAYFKHPEMGDVGFEAILDTSDLRGKFKLQIYVRRQKQFFSCPNIVEIRY